MMTIDNQIVSWIIGRRRASFYTREKTTTNNSTPNNYHTTITTTPPFDAFETMLFITNRETNKQKIDPKVLCFPWIQSTLHLRQTCDRAYIEKNQHQDFEANTAERRRAVPKRSLSRPRLRSSQNPVLVHNISSTHRACRWFSFPKTRSREWAAFYQYFMFRLLVSLPSVYIHPPFLL